MKGALTDGFDSTASSMRTLFPGARLGSCLRHALNKLPDKLIGVAAPRAPGFTREVPRPVAPVSPAHKLTGGGVGPAPTPLCRPHRHTVGEDHGERVRHWFQDKKAGWYTVLADPQMPARARCWIRPTTPSTGNCL